MANSKRVVVSRLQNTRALARPLARPSEPAFARPAAPPLQPSAATRGGGRRWHLCPTDQLFPRHVVNLHSGGAPRSFYSKALALGASASRTWLSRATASSYRPALWRAYITALYVPTPRRAPSRPISWNSCSARSKRWPRTHAPMRAVYVASFGRTCRPRR